jgi:hypothetical protein
MTKTTYLLGAGASVGNGKYLNNLNQLSGIPVVGNFNNDVSEFLSLMARSNDYMVKDNKRYKVDFLEIFNKMDFHYTFDTYAKKLFILGPSKKNELVLLKRLLNSYLVFRHLVGTRDKRYDLFFATILNEHKLSSDFNFISYNYDTFIEQSLSSFSIDQNFRDYINRVPGDDLYPDKSFLFKLNGSASSIQTNGFNDDFLFKLNHSFDISPSMVKLVDIDHLIENLNYFPQINFSWESISHSYDNKLYEVLKQTEVLVIIGYSFPTINRISDLRIISKLPMDCKIVLQVGANNLEVKSRLDNLINSVITSEGRIYSELIKNMTVVEAVDQFYVP